MVRKWVNYHHYYTTNSLFLWSKMAPLLLPGGIIYGSLKFCPFYHEQLAGAEPSWHLHEGSNFNWPWFEVKAKIYIKYVALMKSICVDFSVGCFDTVGYKLKMNAHS